MERKLTMMELETGLAEVLARVRGGERFVVERDGEAVAVLSPPAPVFTWGDFVVLLRTAPRPDPDFADDLEAIQAAQGVAEVFEWPD